MIPRLSIIIPTYNEETNLKRLLSALPLKREDLEVIVSDGRSSDKTLIVAEEFDVITTSSDTGRGKQLNRGLEISRGSIVWFLHADSAVDEQHVDAIFDQFESSDRIIGGNFAILFDGKDAFSLWLNRFYRTIRQRGFYYGDSGIFILKHELMLIGGMSERSVMEDYELTRKMEKGKKSTVCINAPKIISSSRRFLGRKKSHIIIGWIVVHILFYLKIPDRYLVKYYDARRERASGQYNP